MFRETKCCTSKLILGGLTPRAASVLLELALGGVSAEGSRRALLVTGRYLPDQLRPRIERRYRIKGGALSTDD